MDAIFDFIEAILSSRFIPRLIFFIILYTIFKNNRRSRTTQRRERQDENRPAADNRRDGDCKNDNDVKAGNKAAGNNKKKKAAKKPPLDFEIPVLKRKPPKDENGRYENGVFREKYKHGKKNTVRRESCKGSQDSGHGSTGLNREPCLGSVSDPNKYQDYLKKHAEKTEMAAATSPSPITNIDRDSFINSLDAMQDVKDVKKLRQAFILSEILAKPKSLKNR